MGKKKYCLIFLLLLIMFSGCMQKNLVVDNKITQSEIRDYLQRNYSAIDLEDEFEFSDLAMIDPDLNGKEIFFTAEIHGNKANAELRMKFLKYFKEKTDFKYYLCEDSYSGAYFLNKYLDTGDISILEELYRPLKGTFAWNKDSYNHWKKLFEYNESLPENRKIKVVGIDIEHQPVTAYRFLVDVLPSKEPPKEIKDRIEDIKSTLSSLEELGDDRTFQCSERLQKDMKKKEVIYKEYLEENFFGFNLVNLNVLNASKAYRYTANDIKWNNIRDGMIYENFLAIQRELPKGKYYGQWGLNHTFQAREKKIMWFGSYLNAEDSIFKDKILTIIYSYDDCEQMTRPSYGTYGTAKITNVFLEIKDTNDLIDGNLNVYKLNGEESPFSMIPMYYSLTGEKLDKGMLDFFQYVICIKGFKAVEPLNDEYN